jgi:hypothetical protein
MISSYKKIQVQQDKKPWPINPLFTRRWTAEQKMGGLPWEISCMIDTDPLGLPSWRLWFWRWMMMTIKNHNVYVLTCSWFMYLSLNFRVEQEGQSSIPQTPGSFWGSMCCPPNTLQGLTKKREVRHAIVNATLIEHHAISVGSSHTNPKHFSLCPVNAGHCSQLKTRHAIQA